MSLIWVAGIGTFIVLAVALPLETFLYFAKHLDYYRFGPAICRERWQTSATVNEVLREIDRARIALRLSTRLVGNTLLLRPLWWKFSAGPRFLLRVESDLAGAVLHYEVRPFLSGTLLILLFLLAIPLGVFPRLSAFMLLYCLGLYAFTWLEMRKVRRLGSLRKHLRGIGLRVCDRCGYDLHGHAPDQRCPECGWLDANQPSILVPRR